MEVNEKMSKICVCPQFLAILASNMHKEHLVHKYLGTVDFQKREIGLFTEKKSPSNFG